MKEEKTKLNKWSSGYCCSCGKEGLVYTFENPSQQRREDIPTHSHCKICYSTDIGDACCYPDQYEETSLMKTMAQLGHLLLQELSELKKKGSK